jgi:hypothetical protein
LAACIESQVIAVEAVDLAVGAEQEALARFDARPAFRNRGEAEVLALAATRGYIVGSDEVAVRRAALSEFGVSRLAGTLDFLKWAVVEGRATALQAEILLKGLDVGPGILRELARRGLTVVRVLSG